MLNKRRGHKIGIVDVDVPICLEKRVISCIFEVEVFKLP